MLLKDHAHFLRSARRCSWDDRDLQHRRNAGFRRDGLTCPERRHIDGVHAVQLLALVIRPFGLILRLASATKKGRRTIDRSRSRLSTTLRRSRRSESDGSVVDRAKQASFDHLVGSGWKRWRYLKSGLLCRLCIKDQLKLRWLIQWNHRAISLRPDLLRSEMHRADRHNMT